MADPSFVGAGSAPGTLELWRIEQFQCVKVSPVAGKLFSGDSYILLSTSSTLRHTIHYWLGGQSSQDERGVASYKAAELDELLGGAATQYREVEGNESPLFLSYFKATGLTYLAGGVESGTHHATAAAGARLLQLRGKRTVRAKEVPLAAASLTQRDVFLLDAGTGKNQLFLFNGPHASLYEKAKGVEVAAALNADERGGKAALVHMDDEPNHAEFWGLLGGYVNPATLPAGDGPTAETPPAQKIIPRLFKIGSAAGGLSDVAPYPFTKDMLTSDLVCMLHSTSGRVYVWIGKQAPVDVKRNSMFIASQYVKLNNFPINTLITRVGEGAETAAFITEFARWSPMLSFGLKATAAGRLPPTDAAVDVKELLVSKVKEDTPVDDGKGTVQVWRVADFQKVAVDATQHGQFYGGESYLVQYTYKAASAATRHIIYAWHGMTSSADDKGAAAQLAGALDKELGDTAVQVRVTQGKEPAHFRALFKGTAVVHLGGKAADSAAAADAGLFQVTGTTEANTAATQVALAAASLNSDDAFVLVGPQTAFVWSGRGAVPAETAAATTSAGVLAQAYQGRGGRAVVPVAEGEDTEAVWALLGGRAPYAQAASGEQLPKPARLFQASAVAGSFKTAEEVHDFEQSDLADDDVYLMDIFTQRFVWVGALAPEDDRKKAFEVADRFVQEANDGRSRRVPIVKVVSGAEPPFFTAQFRSWDDKWAERNRFKDAHQTRLDKLAADKVNSLVTVAAVVFIVFADMLSLVVCAGGRGAHVVRGVEARGGSGDDPGIVIVIVVVVVIVVVQRLAVQAAAGVRAGGFEKCQQQQGARRVGRVIAAGVCAGGLEELQ